MNGCLLDQSLCGFDASSGECIESLLFQIQQDSLEKQTISGLCICLNSFTLKGRIEKENVGGLC